MNKLCNVASCWIYIRIYYLLVYFRRIIQVLVEDIQLCLKYTIKMK